MTYTILSGFRSFCSKAYSRVIDFLLLSTVAYYNRCDIGGGVFGSRIRVIYFKYVLECTLYTTVYIFTATLVHLRILGPGHHYILYMLARSIYYLILAGIIDGQGYYLDLYVSAVIR